MRLILFILALGLFVNFVIPQRLIANDAIEIGEMDETEKEGSEENEENKKKELNERYVAFQSSLFCGDDNAKMNACVNINAQDIYYTIDTPPPEIV
ncbi:MAG: hypothetical protein OCD76_21395 [Reichenbachiella sp.]